MATKSGDTYVLLVQKWLNDNYGNDSRFKRVTEDGYVGWGTINGLIRALQIELGIQQTADNFGTGTVNAFKAQYPNGIHQQEDGDTTERKIYGIIQGGLLCKGYATGVSNPTLHFYNGTGNAVKRLKRDAGIDDSSSTVTLNIMKALLSMDYFVTYKTDSYSRNIRMIQQQLNGICESYIGLKPCDGVYGSGTSKAMLYALQITEKLPSNVANGNFGETTRRTCPTIPYSGVEKSYFGTQYTDADIVVFISLIRDALYINGFEEDTGFSISGVYNASLKKIIEDFQRFFALPVTGIVDVTTWAALLISCGDTKRPAVACDCATIITEDNVEVLKNNGYKYVARYISGYVGNGVSKALTTEELQILFKNGIRVFPIYQEAGNSSSYFTTTKAEEDAINAAKRADELQLQYGSIIYFAVDCDLMDYQITNLIMPYFKVLHETFLTKCLGKYRVGVYGTRNLCTRVCNAGYACSSFVANMATGWSGNLGFKMPNNWAIDQYAGATIESNGKKISIDKDGISGRYSGISQEYSRTELITPTTNISDGTAARILINMTNQSVPVYADKTIIYPEDGSTCPVYETSGEQIGEIKPRDFYIRYQVTQPSLDIVHKVMFNDGTDVKIGYITERAVLADIDIDPKSDTAVSLQILPGHDVFTCAHYDETIKDFKIIPMTGNNHEFTIQKPVPYFEGNGKYMGTLVKGDKIRIIGDDCKSTGETSPTRTYVNQIKRQGANDFETANVFVNIGLEYGCRPEERAWL